VLVLACFAVSCSGRTIKMPERQPTADQLAELWIDPGAERRDLLLGIGASKYAPPKDVTYKFMAKDDTGFSASYDVTSPDGVEWSAKIGPEAQTEVVVSRILWGLGYHQPPVYYLPSWNLELPGGEMRKESEARFRPKLDHLKRLDEYWTWEDNPFIGARPYNGLIVVLLMLNSTDLKNDNNSVYELTTPWDGASRWFVVRDLGAALGVTGKLFPRRNWIDGFEKGGFITGVKGGRVGFDYDGRHQHLLAMITPADVRWASTRMQRLTDEQWRAAFRAANYTDEIAGRFIRKIKEKIAQGLALREATTDEDRGV
jgi:hypothetical protein